MTPCNFNPNPNPNPIEECIVCCSSHRPSVSLPPSSSPWHSPPAPSEAAPRRMLQSSPPTYLSSFPPYPPPLLLSLLPSLLPSLLSSLLPSLPPSLPPFISPRRLSPHPTWHDPSLQAHFCPGNIRQNSPNTPHVRDRRITPGIWALFAIEN
jgi:hypothetical protein